MPEYRIAEVGFEKAEAVFLRTTIEMASEYDISKWLWVGEQDADVIFVNSDNAEYTSKFSLDKLTQSTIRPILIGCASSGDQSESFSHWLEKPITYKMITTLLLDLETELAEASERSSSDSEQPDEMRKEQQPQPAKTSILEKLFGKAKTSSDTQSNGKPGPIVEDDDLSDLNSNIEDDSDYDVYDLLMDSELDSLRPGDSPTAQSASVQTKTAPAERSSAQSVEPSTTKPAEKPSVKPVESSAAKSVKKQPSAQSVESSTAKSAEKPSLKPVESSTAKSAEKPSIKPVESSTAKSVKKQPSVESVESSTAKPAEKPSVKPVESSTAKSAEKPSVKPVESSTAKSAEKPPVKPVENSTAKPAEKPSVQPIESSTAKSVESPSAQPTESSTAQPIGSSADKSVKISTSTVTTVPPRRFLEDRRFLGLLRKHIKSDNPTEITHYKYPPVRIYPKQKLFAHRPSHELTSDLFTAQASGFTIHELLKPEEQLPVEGWKSKPIWLLFYLATLFGSEGGLKDNSSPHDLLSLTSKPDFDIVPNNLVYMVVADYMINKEPQDFNTIADGAGVDAKTVINFCNACEEINIVERTPYKHSEIRLSQNISTEQNSDTAASDKNGTVNKGFLNRFMSKLKQP